MGPPYRDFFFLFVNFLLLLHYTQELRLRVKYIKKNCFRNEPEGRRKTFEMELHCRDFVLVMDI